MRYLEEKLAAPVPTSHVEKATPTAAHAPPETSTQAATSAETSTATLGHAETTVQFLFNFARFRPKFSTIDIHFTITDKNSKKSSSETTLHIHFKNITSVQHNIQHETSIFSYT